MNTGTKRAFLIGMVVISLAIVSAAYAVLDITPLKQNIQIGGEKNYTVKLHASPDHNGSLNWETFDPNIVASIQNEAGVWAPYGQTGKANVSYPGDGSVRDYTMTVRVLSSYTGQINVDQDIEVKYFNNVNRVKAQVTGTAVPVPELSTGILMSVGLIGLLGVGIRRRKD